METQQRIIYSGRLLQDDVQLKDVLRQVGIYSVTQVINHLVCTINHLVSLLISYFLVHCICD